MIKCHWTIVGEDHACIPPCSRQDGDECLHVLIGKGLFTLTEMRFFARSMWLLAVFLEQMCSKAQVSSAIWLEIWGALQSISKQLKRTLLVRTGIGRGKKVQRSACSLITLMQSCSQYLSRSCTQGMNIQALESKPLVEPPFRLHTKEPVACSVKGPTPLSQRRGSETIWSPFPSTRSSHWLKSFGRSKN